MWVYLWALCCAPLIHMSVFVPIPCYFDDRSFVGLSEVWEGYALKWSVLCEFCPHKPFEKNSNAVLTIMCVGTAALAPGTWPGRMGPEQPWICISRWISWFADVSNWLWYLSHPWGLDPGHGHQPAASAPWHHSECRAPYWLPTGLRLCWEMRAYGKVLRGERVLDKHEVTGGFQRHELQPLKIPHG